MPTCSKHGSGGIENKKLGLIRYLAWVTCGFPKDTPAQYARSVAIAAALEMLFNHGYGTVEQKLNAAMWLTKVEHPLSWKEKKELSDSMKDRDPNPER